MRITPLDVRKQEFRRVVRGLDADEVYAFLTTVADEYEAVLSDNKQLREKVIDLDEKVSEYRNMETTLRDTLLTAERVMSEARQNARKEAELILRDASIRASEQTASISSEVDKLKGQLRELRGQRDSFLARLQSLAESQIGLAESYRRDFEREDRNVSVEPTPAGGNGPAAEVRPPGGEDPVAENAVPENRAAEGPVAENPIPEASEPPASDPRTATDREASPPSTPDEAPPTRESSPASAGAPASPRPSSGEDHWRSYQVGVSETRGQAHPPDRAEPTSDEVVDLALEVDEISDAPTRASAPASQPAPPVETQVDSLPPQDEGTSSEDISHDDPSQHDPSHEDPSHEDPSHEDPIDRVARMMAEAAGDDGAHVSGQDPEPVATSSAPEETRAAEGESDEDSSRWSLSRFTKGLSNF